MRPVPVITLGIMSSAESRGGGVRLCRWGATKGVRSFASLLLCAASAGSDARVTLLLHQAAARDDADGLRAAFASPSLRGLGVDLFAPWAFAAGGVPAQRTPVMVAAAYGALGCLEVCGVAIWPSKHACAGAG